MNEYQIPTVQVERLREYTEADAAGIGRLLPMLSPKFDASPVPEAVLRRIIEADDAEQLVARGDARRIIGAATLSTVYGAAMGRHGSLQDVIVDTDARGMGVGRALMDEIQKWADEKDMPIEFTSNATRGAAHRLYLSAGAEIRDTTVFRLDPRKQN